MSGPNSAFPAGRKATAAGALLALALSGCGTHQGRFRLEGGRPDCRVHQTEKPGTAYTGGVNGDTEAILGMMSYLTAHGSQPYCDGRPPNDIDRHWSALYAELGGTPALAASTAGRTQTSDIGTRP
jgi:hypothetical protein